MRPDSYMRMYWKEFWMAMEGHPDQVIVAYQRAFSHYYHHNHCAGLNDDDEFLRRICRVERQDWARVRGTIFDNEHFFTQDETGKWHQKRAELEWLDAKERYAKAVARGKNGAKKRWGKKRKL